MEYRGTLIRQVLGGRETWSLRGERTLELRGDVPAALDGKSVVVDGRPAPAFGFGMTGDVIEVKRVWQAPGR